MHCYIVCSYVTYIPHLIYVGIATIVKARCMLALQTWILEIAFVRDVGVCVCMCARMCVHPQGYNLHSCDI